MVYQCRVFQGGIEVGELGKLGKLAEGVEGGELLRSPARQDLQPIGTAAT
jgi:hypothetical protein